MEDMRPSLWDFKATPEAWGARRRLIALQPEYVGRDLKHRYRYNDFAEHLRGSPPMSDGDSEGVRTPPPVVYLGLIILGIGLQFRWPMRFLPGQISIPVGLAVIGLSLILFAWTVRTFLAAKTSLDHRKPTTALISSGPFRFSRNPIYVSMTMFGLGVGALLDNLWVVLLMLPAILVIRFFVISKEEAFMNSKFGEDYLRYKASVRRWL